MPINLKEAWANVAEDWVSTERSKENEANKQATGKHSKLNAELTGA